MEELQGSKARGARSLILEYSFGLKLRILVALVCFVFMATMGWVAFRLGALQGPEGQGIKSLGIAWAVLSSLTSAAICMLLLLLVVKPIRKLADATARIAKGQYGEPLLIEGRAELGLLAQSIQLMEERVRERERQLERSRKEYQAIFESVPSYIAVVNRDFRIAEANRNFRETFGGALGDYCFHVYKNRDQKCEACLVEKSFQDGSPHRSEERGVTREGEEIPYLVYTAPVMNEWGQVDHVIEMSVDLRPLKALEQEKLQAERLAVVGETVASLAHGIKNILTGLEGGVYVTQTAMTKGDQVLLQKGWAMVERNIDRISHLVRDLLAYSRVGIMNMQPANPNEVVEEAAGLFLETASRMGIELILELDPSLGPIPMDTKAIHTCLVNLLSNALDACAEDKKKSYHKVILRTDTGPAGEILFEVMDNGIGMDQATRQKLFHRFFSTKGTKGTGLGLMLTHKLVHEHGGSISVESKPGSGSRFCISLPAVSSALANG